MGEVDSMIDCRSKTNKENGEKERVRERASEREESNDEETPSV